MPEHFRQWMEALSENARTDRSDCLSALLSRHETQFYRVALRITASPEDAEDALQESLLNAYLHLGDFRGEARFSTWFVRIVARQAISRLRWRRSRREVPLDAPVEADNADLLPREIEDNAEGPEMQCLKGELRTILFQTIDELDPPLRVALVMRELGTFSINEMADALDISVPVAKSRLFRARRRLRDLVLKQLTIYDWNPSAAESAC